MELFLTRLWGHFPQPTVPFIGRDLADEHGLRYLALVLAYQGGPWAGWQLQKEAPSIQGELEKVLSKLCGHEVRVAASGRTDAGVHAFGQVASFATHSRLPLNEMLPALISMLPDSIFPLTLGAVNKDFHARFHALAKTYDYYLAPHISCGAFLTPFLWPIDKALEEKPVKTALMMCVGRRDMRALSSGAPEKGGSTVRNILEARLDVKPGLWRIRLTAQGFLRHAVRNLVGILVNIGQGRLTPGQLLEMLRAGEKLYSAPKAPPNGLYLQKVYYHPWIGPAAD